MGFRTEMTEVSGDGGIDIVATVDKPLIGGRYLIQCKRFAPDNLVGAATVRDFYGAVTADRQAIKGILITTSGFTPQALAFAQQLPMELIGGQQLQRFSPNTGFQRKVKVAQARSLSESLFLLDRWRLRSGAKIKPGPSEHSKNGRTLGLHPYPRRECCPRPGIGPGQPPVHMAVRDMLGCGARRFRAYGHSEVTHPLICWPTARRCQTDSRDTGFWEVGRATYRCHRASFQAPHRNATRQSQGKGRFSSPAALHMIARKERTMR